MNATEDKKKAAEPFRGTKSEKIQGAAVNLVRSVPGLKQSVLSGVALLTRHETGYLQAKLKKEESKTAELTERCEELTSILASVSKHIEREQKFNKDVKNEAAAVRRVMFVEHQREAIKQHFPEYSRYLASVETLEKRVLEAMSARIMPVIVLTHIQKTAGNSIIAYLRRCLTVDRIARIHEFEMSPREDIERAVAEKFGHFDVLAGHIPFCRRVDELTAPRESINISILREPVDRVVSLYYYLRANASWLGQGQTIIEKKITLESFANSEAYFDNHMVRMLCDLEPIAVPLGACTKEMLEQAKINIVKHFLLVGLTEQTPEFLAVLARLFCFSLEDVPSENVNKQRSSISSVSKEALNAIAKHNSYDVELYEFVQKLWNVTAKDWLSQSKF
ncbi:MAG: sulfotransferase family 2 domain-containing protein [Candidatus Obscuribacterales bacterium]|nr:sulfotransferase family 2 domain-containing protein [Candidatus Obscuribacterales bacterium]